MPRGQLIQLRRGTEAQWIAAEAEDAEEEALADGEVGLVIDETGAIQYLVIGDEEVEFADLPKFYPGDGGGGSGGSLVESYVWDGTQYVLSPMQRFYGPVDPATQGFTLNDGDEWVESA